MIAVHTVRNFGSYGSGGTGHVVVPKGKHFASIGAPHTQAPKMRTFGALATEAVGGRIEAASRQIRDASNLHEEATEHVAHLRDLLDDLGQGNKAESARTKEALGNAYNRGADIVSRLEKLLSSLPADLSTEAFSRVFELEEQRYKSLLASDNSIEFDQIHDQGGTHLPQGTPPVYIANAVNEKTALMLLRFIRTMHIESGSSTERKINAFLQSIFGNQIRLDLGYTTGANPVLQWDIVSTDNHRSVGRTSVALGGAARGSLNFGPLGEMVFASVVNKNGNTFASIPKNLIDSISEFIDKNAFSGTSVLVKRLRERLDIISNRVPGVGSTPAAVDKDAAKKTLTGLVEPKLLEDPAKITGDITLTGAAKTDKTKAEEARKAMADLTGKNVTVGGNEKEGFKLVVASDGPATTEGGTKAEPADSDTDTEAGDKNGKDEKGKTNWLAWALGGLAAAVGLSGAWMANNKSNAAAAAAAAAQQQAQDDDSKLQQMQALLQQIVGGFQGVVGQVQNLGQAVKTNASQLNQTLKLQQTEAQTSHTILNAVGAPATFRFASQDDGGDDSGKSSGETSSVAALQSQNEALIKSNAPLVQQNAQRAQALAATGIKPAVGAGITVPGAPVYGDGRTNLNTGEYLVGGMVRGKTDGMSMGGIGGVVPQSSPFGPYAGYGVMVPHKHRTGGHNTVVKKRKIMNTGSHANIDAADDGSDDSDD